MDIDELKDAWNNDDQNKKDLHLPLNDVIKGKTSSVTAKLRRNMKIELIATLVSYVILLAALFGWHHSTYLFNILFMLLLIMIVLNAYYFFRFYLFYKSIGHFDLSVKNSIRKITYELELNTEIYKAYNFCIAPLAVIIALGLIFDQPISLYIQHTLINNSPIPFKYWIIAFANLLITFIIVYVCLNWQVRSMYGKHLTELKKVMNDLESED
ncbi:MAG TPA: hypothetical protein VK609_19600 [Mucilaginibacter sp.]|nr:hypothetical protein [Mucilaginibacter sp.]